MAGFAFQRRNERGCGKLFFRKQRDLVMTSLPRVLLVAILLAPVAAYSQSGGGGGQGEADRLVVERAAGVLPVGQLVPDCRKPKRSGHTECRIHWSRFGGCKRRSERSGQSRRPQQFSE